MRRGAEETKSSSPPSAKEAVHRSAAKGPATAKVEAKARLRKAKAKASCTPRTIKGMKSATVGIIKKDSAWGTALVPMADHIFAAVARALTGW